MPSFLRLFLDCLGRLWLAFCCCVFFCRSSETLQHPSECFPAYFARHTPRRRTCCKSRSFSVARSCPCCVGLWDYLLRASILPFTVYLGIRGLVLGAPVVHDNTIVQCLVFMILVGAILAAPGLVCRDVIPSLLSAAFWLIWAVATSLTVPVACVAMCRRAAGLQSLEAAAHVLIGLVAAVVWWFAFWTGWTASITQWLAALVPLYVSARCVVG